MMAGAIDAKQTWVYEVSTRHLWAANVPPETQHEIQLSHLALVEGSRISRAWQHV